MGIDHQLDWKALSFVSKLLGILLVVGAIGQLGFSYIESQHVSPSKNSLSSPAPLVPIAEASTLSTTTTERVINTLSIADTIPSEGKFIVADLSAMQMSLYKDGAVVAEYPIKTKGRPGTPWETPSGVYTIHSKEENHFSSIGKVYMPYSMQFYGNYFIHGWTYYPDGTPTPFTFSGGCIKLDTENAKAVFAFADVGTRVFVYDPKTTNDSALTLNAPLLQDITARSYLVADIDTGDVYGERGATEPHTAGPLVKLMTALVANETISLDKKVSIEEGSLLAPQDAGDTTRKTFYVDDLFYPLLMQSNNEVAGTLASYYGKAGFVRWMNSTAHSLDMESSTFADPTGVSEENLTTTEDIYRLARYLSTKKSFVIAIATSTQKTIRATDGSKYVITASSPQSDTSLLVVAVPTTTHVRRIAVVVLGSNDPASDTAKLSQWIRSSKEAEPACLSCLLPHYRKIEP